MTDIITEIVNPFNLKLTDLQRTSENAEYGGSSFTLDGKTVQFRVAKIIPNKLGQFVALYNRCTSTNKIIPFGTHDNFNYVFVATFEEEYRGIFIFNQDILLTTGIFTSLDKQCKLAFRVDAPWINVLAAQAVKTNEWQNNYFTPLNHFPFAVWGIK